MLVGEVENVDQLALELGCKIGTLSTTYLGLPLGSRQTLINVWDGVEEKFRRKLALWKRQYISKGGRLTFIRSMMSNLPIYTMSLFWMPRGVSSRLRKSKVIFCGGVALPKERSI